MAGICRGTHASPEHLEIAKTMFNAVGRTVVVDEKNMDAVTGLSASGPAFAYIILESFAEAGVKVGLPRDVATLLAAQTMKGAAERCGDDACGLHHRWHHGTRGREASRHAHQGRSEGHATRRRTSLREVIAL
jgi:pyrroline-5-carboxylate reductase